MTVPRAQLLEWEAQVDRIVRFADADLKPFRQTRDRLRALLAGPVPLPSPRFRSVRQARVAACPNCGARE